MERQHLSKNKKAICLQQRFAIASSNRESVIAQHFPHPIEELQGAIGNRAVNQLLANQPRLQAKPMFRGLSGELRSPSPLQAQLAKDADSASVSEAQTENKTRLPDNLKIGIENLSGIAMDDVRVHKNSSKPSQLQALAYTQGTDIHVAPGQETHLPHEAWHVVQQKQGRVKPTIQAKGVGINDDPGLEKEADVMGAKVVQGESIKVAGATSSLQRQQAQGADKPIQMMKLPQWLKNALGIGRVAKIKQANDEFNSVGSAERAVIQKIIFELERQGIKDPREEFDIHELKHDSEIADIIAPTETTKSLIETQRLNLKDLEKLRKKARKLDNK